MRIISTYLCMLSQTISTKIHAMRFASFRYMFSFGPWHASFCSSNSQHWIDKMTRTIPNIFQIRNNQTSSPVTMDIRRSPTLLRDSTNSSKERSFRKGDPANSHAARKYQANVVWKLATSSCGVGRCKNTQRYPKSKYPRYWHQHTKAHTERKGWQKPQTFWDQNLGFMVFLSKCLETTNYTIQKNIIQQPMHQASLWHQLVHPISIKHQRIQGETWSIGTRGHPFMLHIVHLHFTALTHYKPQDYMHEHVCHALIECARRCM